MKSALFFIFSLLTLTLHGEPLTDIIDNYLRYNKWQQAKEQLESYLEVNTTDASAYSFYAQVLEELNQYDQAIIAIRKAINYEQSPEIKGKYYYELGRYYYSKNLPDLAIEMFDQSVTYNGMIASPYYLKGLIFYEKNQLDQCLAAWKKYTQLTTNLSKKQKIRSLIDHFERKMLDDKLRKEEEERKKKQLLEQLKHELSDSETDSSSMEVQKEITDGTFEEYFEDVD